MASVEEQLEQTLNELDGLRQEYSDFAYIVSHEFAAPFRHITGFTQMAIDHSGDTLSSQSLRDLNIVLEAGEKGHQIIEHLLSYSRLNSRAKPFAPTDCTHILEGVKRELAPLIEEKQAQIKCDQLPVNMMADGEQLRVLFFHLIKNALIYNDATPRILIECDDKKDTYEMRFSDNGIGIKENKIEHIFLPLRRAVSDKKYPGMGMGLAIAKKIVCRHGGDISCRPAPLGGTQFYFSLSKNLINT